MAGDDIEMGVNYYVRAANNTRGSSMTSQAVNLLVGLIGSAAGGAVVHGASSPTTYYNSESHLGVLNFLNNGQPDDNMMPRAYLTWLFFDENFNYIPYDATTGLGSYSKQIETAGDAMNLLNPTVTAPKNGYAFIYVSNESDAQTVYFDNLAVVHTRSKLLEEATYYPFGLKIAALSAQAFQKPTAPDKFQGDYSDYEEETGWNDFELRSYDPQIGRWLQVDPYDQYSSPYMGMGNDPINNTDPNGGSILSGNGLTFLNHMEIGTLTGIIGAFANKEHPVQGFLEGFGAGVLGSYTNWKTVQDGVIDGLKWVNRQVNRFFERFSLDGVVTLVGGADLYTNGDISEVTKNIEKELNDFYKKNHMKVIVKSFESDPEARTMDDVYDYMKKNSKRSRPQFVYGYSLGANTANQAIKMLKEDGQDVDLFYSVDAALGLLSKAMEIPDNVKQVINVYQTDRSPIGSRGYPARAIEGNNKTKITNVPFDKFKSKSGFGAHGNMDDDLQNSVIKTFQNQMKLLLGK